MGVSTAEELGAGDDGVAAFATPAPIPPNAKTLNAAAASFFFKAMGNSFRSDQPAGCSDQHTAAGHL